MKSFSFFLALADTGYGARRKYLNETFLTTAKGQYTNLYHPEESWTSVLLLCTGAKQKGTLKIHRKILF